MAFNQILTIEEIYRDCPYEFPLIQFLEVLIRTITQLKYPVVFDVNEKCRIRHISYTFVTTLNAGTG